MGSPMGECSWACRWLIERPWAGAHGPPMGRCSRDAREQRAREQRLRESHGRSMSAAHGTAHEQLTMGGPWTI